MAFNIVRYSQQDPQWKNDKIGGGPDTIGYIGCALTCAAMYTSGWGFTETPGSLNKKLAARGGFIDEAIVWGAVAGLYPQIKSTGLTICTDSDAPLAPIDASLAAGQPVIVEVDFSPDAGLQTHWILLYTKQGNDYLLLDPWPYPPDTKDVTLISRFSQGKPLRRAIKAVAWYQFGAGGSVPPSTSGGSTTTTPSVPPPAPVETDLLLQVVAAATAGLRLHIQASQDSPANFAEMPGTQLRVIEDKASALAKLGQNDKWIYVRDPGGHQGYVAAWYVEKAAGAAPAPTPPTPAPSTPPPASTPQRFQVVVLQSAGAGGLPVRQQPSQGAALINKEKAGARLTVIEPPDSAMRKIGVAGQWIAIKATNNKPGYVLAQYVKVRS